MLRHLVWVNMNHTDIKGMDYKCSSRVCVRMSAKMVHFLWVDLEAFWSISIILDYRGWNSYQYIYIKQIKRCSSHCPCQALPVAWYHTSSERDVKWTSHLEFTRSWNSKTTNIINTVCQMPHTLSDTFEQKLFILLEGYKKKKKRRGGGGGVK